MSSKLVRTHLRPIAIIVLAKCLVLGLAILGVLLVDDRSTSMLARFGAGSVGFYMKLAISGYEPDSMWNALYPLWPMVLSLLVSLTNQDPIWVGMAAANVLSCVGMTILYKLIVSRFESRSANVAALFFLAFPGSFFFSVGYSESLFLLLVALLFAGIYQKRFKLIWFSAFLLPLTRPTGILCLAPLLIAATGKGPQRVPKLALFAPVLGFACYCVMMLFICGDAFAGFQAQKYYEASPSIAKIFNVPAFLRALFVSPTFHDELSSIVDRTIFVACAAAVPKLYSMDRRLWAWAIVSVLVPATSSHFMSFTRYATLAFPIYIVWAIWINKIQSRTYRLLVIMALIFLLGSLQVTLAFRFLIGKWAG